mgnify:CR=1 FL=1
MITKKLCIIIGACNIIIRVVPIIRLVNTITIYIAFAIGGINALFLYTSFLSESYYGLVTFLLSTSNLLMPLTAFGVQYTILKFFSSYQTRKEKDVFLSSVILLPLFIAIPIAVVGNVFYQEISAFLSLKNPVVKYRPRQVVICIFRLNVKHLYF